MHVRSVIAIASLFLVIGAAAQDDRSATKPILAPLAPFTEAINGTTLQLTMVPVTPKDGSTPFFIASTETTWDVYDAFVFGFDKTERAADGTSSSASPEADAVTRPSKPYISMDRGFGHAGFPAISVSYLGAKKCCEWMSAKTGKRYRLATLKEWQAACALAAIPSSDVKDFAWCAENAGGKTHAVGTTKKDALGSYDLYGNASEWVTSDEGKGVTLGGTFKGAADTLGCALVVPYTPDWNASDPQYPKSKWWLADGGFVGFRMVCETAKP